MFKKKIMGIPLWLLIIGGLIIFRKKIPIVDQLFEKMKGMVTSSTSTTK